MLVYQRVARTHIVCSMFALFRHGLQFPSTARAANPVATALTNKLLTFWAKRLISGIGDGRVANQSPTFFFIATRVGESVSAPKNEITHVTLGWRHHKSSTKYRWCKRCCMDILPQTKQTNHNQSQKKACTPKMKRSSNTWGAKFLGGVEAQAVPEVQKFMRIQPLLMKSEFCLLVIHTVDG